ncbi:MAG: GntR family transcriptional regulator [Anaerolineae bacterium]
MSENGPVLTGLRKIRKGPLREQVRDQIKNLILTNYLRPGQPIVIDRLASELGVSHTPVREALAMLEHEGLVETRPYGTPQVAEIDASHVYNVWEMRLLLEGWAVKRSVLRLPEEAFDELEQFLESARREARQSRYEAHVQSDIAMHNLILQATDNSLFERMARLVSDQSIRVRWLVETIATVEEVLEIIDEHLALLDALRARDPELAHQRLTLHLKAGLERQLNALERMKMEPVSRESDR